MVQGEGSDLADEMIEAAMQSAQGEAYRSVMRSDDYRAGVIVMMNDGAPAFSIELLLRIFKPFSAVDSSSLERATEAVKMLSENGYLVTHEDDGWLCCRKSIKNEKVVSECESLQELLAGIYDG